MTTKKKSTADNFYCTVSPNGQVFLPVKMRVILKITANDSVRFSLRDDGTVLFAKDDDASAENQGQQEKDKKDKEQVGESLK